MTDRRRLTQTELRRGESATWGPPPPPEQPRMRLLSWKPLHKNSLRGFASIRLPNGLLIDDCPVLVSNGKAWATLPSKPVLDAEGRHAKPDGKPQYALVVRWERRELTDKFSARTIELVRAQHPEAFRGGP
jgi:hypothetical protein